MKMQEELAGMFSRNLNVSEQVRGTDVAEASVIHQSAATVTTSALGYSSSQHYYPPPAHLASKNTLAAHDDEDAEVKHILTQNKIEWTYLLTSQLNLFKQAAPDQRQRLIELWNISPAEKAQKDASCGWKETTLEEEEKLVRIRSERDRASKGGLIPDQKFMVVPQDADMDSAIGDLDHPYAAEPYMSSGYEIMAEQDYNSIATPSVTPYKHALDPVFSGREWWRDFVGNQSMENQYGAFEHMAQFRPSELQVVREDEEML
jgi:hypothetical protein